MDPFHDKTLLKKRPILVNRLEPNKILDDLLAEDVLDREDYDQIRSFTTSQEQSRKLLDLLPLRGSTAYPCFLQALKKGKAKDLAEELEKQECELRRSSGTTAGIQATEPPGKYDWRAALLKKNELGQPVPESGATCKPQIAKTRACDKPTDKVPEATDKKESAKQLTPEVADIPPSVNKLTAMFEKKNTTDEPRKQDRSCTPRQNPSGGGTRHQKSWNTTHACEVNVLVHVEHSSVTQTKCPSDDSEEEPSSSDSFHEDIEPQCPTSSEHPTGVLRTKSSPCPPAQGDNSSQDLTGVQRWESLPNAPSQAPYPTVSGQMAHPHYPVNYTALNPTVSGQMAHPHYPALYPTVSGQMAHPHYPAPYPTEMAHPHYPAPYPTSHGQMPQPHHSDQPCQPHVNTSTLGFEGVASDVTSRQPATGTPYGNGHMQVPLNRTLHHAGYNQSQIPDNNTSQSLNLPPPSFP
ncbi:hypothetical protein LSAT2_003360 [Lamellibrachia satsuma]|nr:hypothetical protein LSAT2_003360 [Lamellibrachia satsuma]